ncbi:ABC transporter permease [Planctopirus hydrillae]|uniref:Transport permease protein n=1 Tax=Planctopirus hydrillae TaxID=1841610 RepID=A0A1C3ENK4_9PLAN|nr:ABC transporter permease [Planctopirus hydrillae]ODA34826.1 ABC transporter [Planctopirus hydrillae]
MATSLDLPQSRTIFWPAVFTLAQREVIRFLRQRSRLIGALAQPILFWILFGAGLRGSFQSNDGASFQAYFLPGVAVMIVLFTAIFSTISIIEDRREGFLQGVLAAPVSRLAIVIGKLLGGSLLAVSQALLFLVIGPVLSLVGLTESVPLGLTISNILPVIGFLTLLAFALTGLGYMIAWQMTSTHGFHAIMSVFLMPMWLLSGAFFPAQEGWLKWVLAVNPLTYGVAGLRQLLRPESAINLPSWNTCLLVTVLFALFCVTVACWQTSQRSIRNVR